MGLQTDGTAVACGSNLWDQCAIATWNDLVAVSAGIDCTLGLRSDGTVLVACSKRPGINEVRNWQDIVAISAGYECCLGLQADGTVLTAGKSSLNRQMLHGKNLFDTMPTQERLAYSQMLRDTRDNFYK